MCSGAQNDEKCKDMYYPPSIECVVQHCGIFGHLSTHETMYQARSILQHGSLELRLSILDFVSQLWRRIGQNLEWRAWVRGYQHGLTPRHNISMHACRPNQLGSSKNYDPVFTDYCILLPCGYVSAGCSYIRWLVPNTCGFCGVGLYCKDS